MEGPMKKFIFFIIFLFLFGFFINKITFYGYEKVKPYTSYLNYQKSIYRREAFNIIDNKEYISKENENYRVYNISINYLYLFKHNEKIFVLYKDSIYSINGKNIINKKFLEKNAEGFFLADNNLYFAHGDEAEKSIFGLGDVSYYRIKKYMFTKLDLTTFEKQDIDRKEYESLYYSYNNIKKDKIYLEKTDEIYSMLSLFKEKYPKVFFWQCYVENNTLYILSLPNCFHMINLTDNSIEELKLNTNIYFNSFVIDNEYYYFKGDKELFLYDKSSNNLEQIRIEQNYPAVE